jgi:hypothetical protein
MESIALILGIGTGVLSVLTFFAGTYAYIKSSATKKYASEREIGQVKETLTTLSGNVVFLTHEIDRRIDSLEFKLAEISAFIKTQANRKDHIS